MGIYKRERTYWISFPYEGNQYQESTGTDNKQSAKDVLAKRQVEIREQRFFDVKKARKLGLRSLRRIFYDITKSGVGSRWIALVLA
jgi:hypothetical protein